MRFRWQCAVINMKPEEAEAQPARFTMTGVVDSVQQDSPSFTLNIVQYLTVTKSEARIGKPVLHLRCHLSDSIWRDPKAVLPYPKTVVSCAGTFSHFEWEYRNSERFARLHVNLDTIEWFSKSTLAGPSTPLSKMFNVYTVTIDII